MAVNIVSLKARGLNSPYKRRALLRDFDCLNGGVLFVQEMHFVEGAVMRLRHRQISHIFTASSQSRKKGVLIAIKDSIEFHLEKCVTDPHGRYLIIVCKLSNVVFTLVNMYA